MDSCPATLFGPWTAQQCREIVVESFVTCKIVHNCFTCNLRDCTNIPKDEERRIQPNKFPHSWLKKDNAWLCYVAEEGMYCLICRKHQMRHPQNQKIPCVRLKLNAVSTHSTSSSFISDRELMLQNVSCFHQEIVKKSEVQYIVLEQGLFNSIFSHEVLYC